MESSGVAIIVSLVIAVVGGFGGLAALFKVSSDSSNSVASGAKSVSDAASGVVEMMSERMDAQEARVSVLEDYVVHFDSWADRLLGILERSIMLMPDVMRAQFEAEVAALKASRPVRGRTSKVS